MRVRLAAVALSLALSAERSAFVYGNDIWTCRLDGSGVQRITSGSGVKMRPTFSPDGSLSRFRRAPSRRTFFGRTGWSSSSPRSSTTTFVAVKEQFRAFLSASSLPRR